MPLPPGFIHLLNVCLSCSVTVLLRSSEASPLCFTLLSSSYHAPHSSHCFSGEGIKSGHHWCPVRSRGPRILILVFHKELQNEDCVRKLNSHLHLTERSSMNSRLIFIVLNNPHFSLNHYYCGATTSSLYQAYPASHVC